MNEYKNYNNMISSCHGVLSRPLQNLKKIASNGGSDRYRLLVSDGESTYSRKKKLTCVNILESKE